MIKMAYEMYKNILNKESYFTNYKSKDYDALTEAIRDKIYDNYIKKSTILNRDEFKCQNVECKTPDSSLTIHHFKHRRNFKNKDKADKIRNMITICEDCHTAFNSAKKPLVYSSEENIPAHIRGHTQMLNKPEKTFNYKIFKNEMKNFRKQLKMQGITYTELDWQTILILMKWLAIPWDEIEDCLED